MARDPHARDEDQYPVRSLYFDTPARDAHTDKQAGIGVRSKWRIRTYLDGTFVLERKEHHVHAIRKESLRISPQIASRLYEGQPCASPLPLVQQFQAEQRLTRLRPTAVVHYRREAYVHTVARLRLTLDHHLCTARPTPHWDDATSPLTSVDNIPARTILEVKTTGFQPTWLQLVLPPSIGAATSISKYVLCVDTLERQCRLPT